MFGNYGSNWRMNALGTSPYAMRGVGSFSLISVAIFLIISFALYCITLPHVLFYGGGQKNKTNNPCNDGSWIFKFIY